MQPGLALSAANWLQIYGTLNVTEQPFFSVNGRHVEKLFLCETLAPLPDTFLCHIAPLRLPPLLFFFPPSKLIRFSSGAMTASINDSRPQIKGI